MSDNPELRDAQLLADIRAALLDADDASFDSLALARAVLSVPRVARALARDAAIEAAEIPQPWLDSEADHRYLDGFECGWHAFDKAVRSVGPS